MSNHRPDIGPRLRRVLADQLMPPPHDIPIHTELGAQIRRGFMTPARGQVFAAFDFGQLEARLVSMQRCAGRASDGYNLRRPLDPAPRRGGTRKIADLPRVCRHPEHNPPSMMVFTPGVYEHTCPGCGASQTFRVDGVML